MKKTTRQSKKKHLISGHDKDSVFNTKKDAVKAYGWTNKDVRTLEKEGKINGVTYNKVDHEVTVFCQLLRDLLNTGFEKKDHGLNVNGFKEYSISSKTEEFEIVADMDNEGYIDSFVSVQDLKRETGVILDQVTEHLLIDKLTY